VESDKKNRQRTELKDRRKDKMTENQIVYDIDKLQIKKGIVVNLKPLVVADDGMRMMWVTKSVDDEPETSDLNTYDKGEKIFMGDEVEVCGNFRMMYGNSYFYVCYITMELKGSYIKKLKPSYLDKKITGKAANFDPTLHVEVEGTKVPTKGTMPRTAIWMLKKSKDNEEAPSNIAFVRSYTSGEEIGQGDTIEVCGRYYPLWGGDLCLIEGTKEHYVKKIKGFYD
jgi:hypothetical protein